MINKFKHIKEFNHLMLKDYTAEKITVYMATELAEDGYDPYEHNTISSNLNPKTIRGYIHDITPEQLIYKQYGLDNVGAVEIVVDEKYYEWFKIANKITVRDIEYKVMREGNAAGTPSNPKGTVVAKRAFKMVRLVLVRRDN